MSREDMKEDLAGMSDEQLDQLLTSMEAKDLVKIYEIDVALSRWQTQPIEG